MANKPDKFGIKFWLIVDNNSKYLLNGFPYLGKDEARPMNIQLPDHVVCKLVEPWMNFGYNVTCDNFFTSKKLADFLLTKKTSILGTVRANRVELPRNLKEIMSKKILHETLVASNDKCILTAYKCKKNKFVTLLSTLHQSITFEDPKNKPITILDYNKTKCGVDVVDQMARLYSCKVSSRRWPMQVWTIFLITCVQTHFPSTFIPISGFLQHHRSRLHQCLHSVQRVYTKKISRRQYILTVVEELCNICTPQPLAADDDVDDQQVGLKRRNCQAMFCKGKGNKTSVKCSSCNKFVCGPCTQNMQRFCRNCHN